MKYILKENLIEIFGKDDFVIQDILECGQVFSYQKIENGFLVFSADKMAKVEENEKGWQIKTTTPKYFENYFDLKTDYGEIKKALRKYPIMKKPLEFGSGIRILRQDLFETLISFIVSANNNIKRIQLILNRLRENLGEKRNGYFAFPTRESLLQKDVEFFKNIGAGYRAEYLYKVVRQIDDDTLSSWEKLDTPMLRQKLISLSGVGPKVADCVLLFAYHRQDVFPVDTWIEQMYGNFYGSFDKTLPNRERIRENLVKEFGDLAGYAQQYLFYSMRSREV